MQGPFATSANQMITKLSSEQSTHVFKSATCKTMGWYNQQRAEITE